MAEPVPYTASYTVDPGFPARAARANARMVLLRGPWLWVGVGFVLLGFAVVGLDAPTYAAIAIAFGVLFVVALPLILLVGGRRTFARQLPPGSVLQAGFGDQTFSTSGPQGSSVILYDAFSSSRRSGDLVLLKARASRKWSLYPGALFSDADLARFPAD